MSFDNSNDPSGIKALLESLRNSQAWADTLKASSDSTNATTKSSTTEAGSTDVPSRAPSSSSEVTDPSLDKPTRTTPSVADLLSQLQASPTLVLGASPATRSAREEVVPQSLPLSYTVHTNARVGFLPDEPVHPKANTRALSFQQALPHISRLLEDPGVMDTLITLKQEQDKLEKQLWEERQAIQRRHEEKVKVARNRAAMIKVPLSKHDAELMSDAFHSELKKFDAERVLSAWDGLVQGQQAHLEALGIPTMFVTTDTGDLDKQRRVMHVLEGVLPADGAAS
ncbi:hypothetical protein BC834DRAFT_898243 [Gloeopeniophorella convolvens]|nr:hypothetical protein BC834DRAFT_898243 [Gloeopeniophorella convolvens]